MSGRSLVRVAPSIRKARRSLLHECSEAFSRVRSATAGEQQLLLEREVCVDAPLRVVAQQLDAGERLVRRCGQPMRQRFGSPAGAAAARCDRSRRRVASLHRCADVLCRIARAPRKTLMCASSDPSSARESPVSLPVCTSERSNRPEVHKHSTNRASLDVAAGRDASPGRTGRGSTRIGRRAGADHQAAGRALRRRTAAAAAPRFRATCACARGCVARRTDRRCGSAR
jgi:hypothetical protein